MSTEHNLYQEKIINLETNQIIWRDYTPAEIAEVEAAQAKAEAKQIELETKATEKAALLNRLGITAEEAKLLLN